jgi:aldehyde dehydrogenase (NAD+)
MNKEFEKLLEKFEIKNLKDFSINYEKTGDTNDAEIKVMTPIDQTLLATIKVAERLEYEQKVSVLRKAQDQWKNVPAPQRGELIRLFGDELRKSKEELAQLVTIESGKILQESLGEVQEMIDICDFAVGLSRQLYGLTMPSERPGHRIQEIWHPLGILGIVTSFNFPVAVWSWNFTLATICGNATLWKPSPKTPLTAIACYRIWQRAIKRSRHENSTEDIFKIIIGDKEQAEWIAKDRNIDLVSLTGSTQMGKTLGKYVTERFGKLIMELGGNNAMILTPSADLKLAVRAIIFSAVGTCGQRCTTLRRVIVHNSIYDELASKLKKYYKTIKFGNPLADDVLIGPMINEESFNQMQNVLEKCKNDGATVSGGERVHINDGSGIYVTPAIVELEEVKEITKTETFAPILYLMPYATIDEAIRIQNDVPQGLSSCIFSQNLLETEQFVGPNGSDCGIVNINIGPSGAEIGGAFGGEKETGGGRESGSDAWKSYMRRSTVTTNFSSELPLSQGINFDI